MDDTSATASKDLELEVHEAVVVGDPHIRKLETIGHLRYCLGMHVQISEVPSTCKQIASPGATYAMPFDEEDVFAVCFAFSMAAADPFMSCALEERIRRDSEQRQGRWTHLYATISMPAFVKLTIFLSLTSQTATERQRTGTSNSSKKV